MARNHHENGNQAAKWQNIAKARSDDSPYDIRERSCENGLQRNPKQKTSCRAQHCHIVRNHRVKVLEL